MAGQDRRARAGRETWRDWLPPGQPEPPLITREELLDALARRGQAMPARTLQRWEAAGALPAPCASYRAHPRPVLSDAQHSVQSGGHGRAP